MYNDQLPSVDSIVTRIESHPFRPVENGMTVEPTSGEDGLDDFADEDWLVRTLAIRDLIRCGDSAAIIPALDHRSPEVRYLAAAALGILEVESSLDRLHRLLREAPESTVRSQAAISIGQIGHEASIPVLKQQAQADEQRDIPPQCRIAIDHIRRYDGNQSDLREAFERLDESSFGGLRVGDRFPVVELPTVDYGRFSVAEHIGERRVVLLWVFADWCPVCHHEFLDLIERHKEFEELDVAVATVECHDVYRSRVMAGREPKPEYWYSHKFPDLSYGECRWWPHVTDFAGALAARLGLDPLAFAVHSEFVNRPATIIIETDGTIAMSYAGTFWGDRPSVADTFELLSSGSYSYEHPQRRRR